MQNFDPEDIVARLAVLEATVADMKRRLLPQLEEAGVGAAQATGAVLDAKEIAGNAETADALAVGSFIAPPNANGPVLFDMGSGTYEHFCPGCKSLHTFQTEGPDGHRWEFTNHDMTAPSFTPSMLRYAMPDIHRPRCHYYLTNGVMEYQADCDHDLKSQKVPLPPIPAALLPKE